MSKLNKKSSKKQSDKQEKLNEIKIKSSNKKKYKHIVIFGYITLLLILTVLTLLNYIYSIDKFKALSANDGTLITLDSLLTGATVTLIAFSNFSPESSASSHIFKNVYWNIGSVSSSKWEINNWLLSWIQPLKVLFITIISTLFEFVLMFIVKDYLNNYILQPLLIVCILITFLMLFSTISRYYTFNRNSLRLASSYVYFIINDAKKMKANEFHAFATLLTYFIGTNNMEFIYLLIRRLLDMEITQEDQKYLNKLGWGKNLEEYLNDDTEPRIKLGSYEPNNNLKMQLLALTYRNIIMNIKERKINKNSSEIVTAKTIDFLLKETKMHRAIAVKFGLLSMINNNEGEEKIQPKKKKEIVDISVNKYQSKPNEK